MTRLLCSVVMLFGPAGFGFAHETTRSCLSVERSRANVTAELRPAFREVDVVVWIDGDLDGALTRAEVARRLPFGTAPGGLQPRDRGRTRDGRRGHRVRPACPVRGRVVLWAGSLAGAAAGVWWLWRAADAIA